jgi:hypothetical protein
MASLDSPVPPTSLLAALAAQRQAYADAYRLELPQAVSLAVFVEAFYSTRLFKLERAVLGLFGRPSSDAAARALACGEGNRLAVWTVEARTASELLMHEDSGATRSWLQVKPAPGGGTALWFGSAVVPRRRGATGDPQLGWVFHALLGLHRVYSRALLRAAAQRVAAGLPAR